MTDSSNNRSTNRSTRFVNFILSKMEKDRAMRARLRRADNPTLEEYSWEYLAPFVELQNQPQRRAFGLVAAALAKTQKETKQAETKQADETKQDGKYSLGKALSGIYKKDENEPAKARLRRILSCKSINELCDVLRPVLSLIAEKSSYPISYSRLLNDLLWFEQNQAIKERWAQDFFASAENAEEEVKNNKEDVA